MKPTWSVTWSDVVDRSVPDALPAPGVLWPALVVLVLVLAWPAARRWGRTLVTIVHEAGHAGVGVLVGRRFLGFVVDKDLSGHAVTSGRPSGPGRILTTWAGYPAPAVLGTLVVLAALGGWVGLVLLVAMVLLLVLLVMSRSVRTAVLVATAGLLAAALWWWGGAWRAGVVAGVGLALLVGAWDSLGDVARTRDAAQDHRTLAQLTPLPAGLWLVTWFLVDAAATALVVLALRDLWRIHGLWGAA